MRTSWTPRTSAARSTWERWPTPAGPYRRDSPSQTITEVTRAPAAVCLATVPPHPNSSSSGCAAITRTLAGSGVTPASPRPRSLAELGSLQDPALVALDLEQHDHPLAALDQLAAGGGHRAHDRADDRARLPGTPAGGRGRGAVAHGPPPAVEPPEGARVRPRQRAHARVALGVAEGPVDQ